MTAPATAEQLAEEIKRLAGEYAHCYAFVGDNSMPIKHRELHAAIDKLASLSSAQQSGEAVAWRWIPSAVWGEYVIVGDKAHAEWAAALGMKVEPLYTRPQQDETGLLRLVCDIRFAVGDNGQRMQPELVEYLKALKTNSDRYEFMRDTDDAMWRPFGLRHGGDAAKADAAIDAARGIGGAR